MAVAFYFDMTSCIGCMTCQVACKDKNDLNVGTLFRQVDGYVVGDYPTPGLFYMSNSCNHCGAPACMAACATGAIYQNEEGAVLIDAEMCDGCGACATACPYGAPKIVDGKAMKCDSCVGIRANGNQPQCVAACPMRALDFGDLAEMMTKYPDAVALDKIAVSPASETVPATLVMPKAIVSADAVQKQF